MDRVTALAWVAQPCFAIMGNPSRREYEIFELGGHITEETSLDLQGRGLAFIGVTGLVDGAPRTCLEMPLDAEAVSALSAAILAHYTQEIERRLRADTSLVERVNGEMFAAYMRQLISAPDTRAN